MSFAD